MKQTPLLACHQRAGAKMVPFAGWELPIHYTSVIEEHRAVRRAVGLFDVSHMGEIRVGGSGAADFLQWLTPNDVEKLTPGRAQYSALLTPEGTFIDDLLVYRVSPDRFMLVVNAVNTQADLEWVRSKAPRGVEIEDISDETALLALQGPRADATLETLTPVELGSLGFYRFAEGEVAGSPALVSRTGYTGEDGFEIYLPAEDGPKVWDRLAAAGQEHGLVPTGLAARDTLRLEAGLPLYGHELDRSTTPLEVGLERLVKPSKWDFVGRAALLEQKQRGVERKLVGFEVTGRGIARQGHPVFLAGRRIGGVTSGTWSPTFEKALGMALVSAESAAPGTAVQLEVRGKEIGAALVELPFYRRPRRRASREAMGATTHGRSPE